MGSHEYRGLSSGFNTAGGADRATQDDELAASVRTLRFLVIDEADRMIETGHFAELENIVGLTQRNAR